MKIRGIGPFERFGHCCYRGQRTRFPKRRQFLPLGSADTAAALLRRQERLGAIPNTATGICAPCSFSVRARCCTPPLATPIGMSRWVMSLEQRRGYQRTLVAIASKRTLASLGRC